EYIKVSKNIRFEGDGYGDEWKKEAEKRGLSNVPKTPDALDFYVSDKALDMFSTTGVMNKVEVEARHEIMLEEYQKRIQIEARVLGDLAGNHIVPTAIRYQNTLIDNVQRLKSILDSKTFDKVAKEQLEMIKEISTRISEIISNKEAMIDARRKANKLSSAKAMAHAYCDDILPYFDKIRYHVDKLEIMVDDEIWPLPKLRELLFTK
ncbi:MAG: glutamine synthetase type III, partial [Schleiferiaceae bacterium]|nr:glutamine synthetase type III [Schleiferiaceae bacterium]